MTKQPPIAKADLQKTQGNRAPAAVKNNDVISFINQPSMKEQLAAALPRHMTAERMIRIATTEIRKVPALGNCDTMSLSVQSYSVHSSALSQVAPLATHIYCLLVIKTKRAVKRTFS